MQFSERVRQLRKQCGLTQRAVAFRVGVTDTYISKVENNNLHSTEFPSEKFIHKLAEVLQADEDELLLLAGKVPAEIRRRMRERPDVFRTLARLDDGTLNRLLAGVTPSELRTSNKNQR